MIRDAARIAADVRSGRVRARAVVSESLARAEETAPLGALLSLRRDAALAEADAVDAAVAAGADPGPLAGVPLVIKDNLCQAGEPCGCASRVLEGYIAPYTGTALARLIAAGAVVVGRANMDEFAMGSSTENSAYFPARNPWDPSRVPGGSSGGSAVAVAAGVAPIALGSETGGSVRQPAGLCGIVGIKPSYGRVSRYGLVAFGSSVDQISPFGRTVADAALALSVMSGPDPRDPSTDPAAAPDWSRKIDESIKGLKIGVPAEHLGDGLESGVADAFERGLQALESRGAVRVAVSLPTLPQCIAIYQVLSAAEASSNLARFDGVRYGPREDGADSVAATRARFGAEVKRRILLGTYVLSAGYADKYYHTAHAARLKLASELNGALVDVDAIATPTSPTVAFRLGERVNNPLAMYLSDLYTAPASLTGHPAISVPVGLSQGLPAGMQLIGRTLDEGTLFALASVVERELGCLEVP